jgi:hypothetical protein
VGFFFLFLFAQPGVVDQSKRVTGERCAELILQATGHKVDEAWIGTLATTQTQTHSQTKNQKLIGMKKKKKNVQQNRKTTDDAVYVRRTVYAFGCTKAGRKGWSKASRCLQKRWRFVRRTRIFIVEEEQVKKK